MKLTPEQRQQLISAIAGGNINQIKEVTKQATGSKVVIRNFLDYLMFFNSVDENGDLVDREGQIDRGEIEVEILDPLSSALARLS